MVVVVVVVRETFCECEYVRKEDVVCIRNGRGCSCHSIALMLLNNVLLSSVSLGEQLHLKTRKKRKMVVCAELSDGLPIVSKEYFKSLQMETDENNNSSNGSSSSFFMSPHDSLPIADNRRIDGTFNPNRYNIKAFYRNANILLTGGTGFVGKVLLEKLLHTCDDIQHVYVLLRSKRGLSSEERYKELIQNPASPLERFFCGQLLFIFFLAIFRLSTAFVNIIRNVCEKLFLSLAIYRSRTLASIKTMCKC